VYTQNVLNATKNQPLASSAHPNSITELTIGQSRGTKPIRIIPLSFIGKRKKKEERKCVHFGEGTTARVTRMLAGTKIRREREFMRFCGSNDRRSGEREREREREKDRRPQ